MQQRMQQTPRRGFLCQKSKNPPPPYTHPKLHPPHHLKENAAAPATTIYARSSRVCFVSARRASERRLQTYSTTAVLRHQRTLDKPKQCNTKFFVDDNNNDNCENIHLERRAGRHFYGNKQNGPSKVTHALQAFVLQQQLWQ